MTIFFNRQENLFLEQRFRSLLASPSGSGGPAGSQGREEQRERQPGAHISRDRPRPLGLRPRPPGGGPTGGRQGGGPNGGGVEAAR